MSSHEPHPHAFGLEAWYPIVRAASGPVAVVAWNDADAGAAAARAWSELEPGGILLVVHRGDHRVVRAALATKSSPVDGWSSSLEDVERCERYFYTHAPGDRSALIEALPGSMRAGARMLRDPRVRSPWRRPLLCAALRWGRPERVALDEATVLVKRGGAASANAARANEAREWIEAHYPGAPVAVALAAPDSLAASGPLAAPDPLAEHDEGLRGVVHLAARDGSPRALVKFATDGRGADLVEREISAMEKLAELGLAGTLAPALLWSGTTDSARVAVFEGLAGDPSPTYATGLHTRFAEHLYARTQNAWSIEELPIHLAARHRLGELQSRSDRGWLFTLERLRYLLALHLGRRPIPCSMAHGDFAPWNLVETAGGVVASEWEHWKNPAPALYDLFHFAVQTSALVAPSTPHKLLSEIESSLEREGRNFFGRTVLARTNWVFLLGLYLFDVCVHEEHARGGSAFASGEYRALRDTRVRLAALVCERLSHIALTAPDKQEDRAA